MTWELRIKGTGLTKITEPWISRRMLKSVNRKNELYQQYSVGSSLVAFFVKASGQKKTYCTSARKTLTGKSVYFKGQTVSKQVQLN